MSSCKLISLSYLRSKAVRLIDRLGIPLPSETITYRILEFQQVLARRFSAQDFFSNSPDEFHVTLFDHRWQRGLASPGPHPIANDPRKLQEFSDGVAAILKKFGPATLFFIGRFLKQITEKEHALILREIDRFNQTPLGSITFDAVKMFYETRYWLSSVKPLAKINL